MHVVHRNDERPCGTRRGEAQHRRRGEDICDECRAARRAYDREWWALRSERQNARKKRKASEGLEFTGGWRLDRGVWKPTGVTAEMRFGDVARMG